MESYVAFLKDIDLADLPQVGGKAANLGHLTGAGYRVPDGFCVKADAFDFHMRENGLRERMREILGSLDFDDLDSVEEGMAMVRELFESYEVPGPVERQLCEAYRHLVAGDSEGTLVAVRSSVGTRDLSATSFPGHMDTYHNVLGEDEVVRLVRKCWASAFSYRAAVNRHARGIEHFDVFVAPLVQLMVPADSAGVIFTANPMNNRTDQVVINACFGLGEGVVSGEVNADHYVLDRGSLEIITREIGDKKVKFVLDEAAGSGICRVPLEPPECTSACLPEEQVRELAGEAVRVENSYGCPQDVEWAYHDGKLYLLQSRAITALGESADAGEWVSEFDTRVDPRYPYYTLSNISEVLCGVLTPLTIAGIDHLDYGFVKTNHDFGLMKGVEPDSEYTFLGIFYGQAHLNLSVVKALTRKLPGASAQEFERMVPECDEDWDDGTFRPTPRALLSLAGPLVRIPYKMIRTPKEVTDIRRRLEKTVAECQRMDPENMSYTAYLEWMDKSREYRSPVIALHITASQFAVVFHDFLRKVTERWLDDPHGALASRLVTGLQNIESAQPGVGIWDLSRKVFGFETLERIFTENEPGEILKALEADPSHEASDFLRSLGTFMEKFGYMSVFEAELMLPNWEDDPSYVFAMIKNYLEAEPGFDPRELSLRQENERGETYEETMRRLKGPKRWLLNRLLSLTQRYIALREYTKATLIIGVAQTKREYHALAGRFAADGVIARPDDLFFLTNMEVEALARGEGKDLAVDELVARRRREYERNKSIVLPEYSKGKPRPLSKGELGLESDVEVLTGISVSPGRVTGAARVITDPRRSSEIRPGEILVAPVTDAAWTPLFLTAGAIVVDVGGPLSHGSIVAREYGIPGVLNVGVATKLVKTGQTITVDGDEGKVYLHALEGADA